MVIALLTLNCVFVSLCSLLLKIGSKIKEKTKELASNLQKTYKIR